VNEVLSEIAELIRKATQPGSRDLWSRTGELAKNVRSGADAVAHELAPYGRAGSAFVRRHGVTLGVIGGAVAVGAVAYYVLRRANRAPRRNPQPTTSAARHIPPT
jgi:uncharacterized membrane protein YebE (DUF533 family)